MNVIVIDAFDWANRIGEQDPDNPDGRPFLYEGVIAHELEHLLMNYSDAGELSWVDEGLADFAAFLNGYPPGGSHITYHQVFHRETSLTRWGGGLENYGASFSFMLYLWEQAGGNGDGTFDARPGVRRRGRRPPDQADLRGAGRRHGGHPERHRHVQRPDRAATSASAEDLFKDWVIALYADDESSDLFNFVNLELRRSRHDHLDDPAGQRPVLQEPRHVQGQRPAGPVPERPARAAADGAAVRHELRDVPQPGWHLRGHLRRGRHDGHRAAQRCQTHWYGGYESLDDNILDVDYTSGDTIDFWTWYFIEEGWDYGFVEALVDGQWVTVPLVDDAGTEVTTDTNPHDNNEEGNGLTGTSGGAYFVDDPVYIHLTGTLPEGTTDVQFRYSTDAAYLDTGWFVDDVQIDGDPVAARAPSPATGSRRPASRTTTGSSRSCRRAT